MILLETSVLPGGFREVKLSAAGIWLGFLVTVTFDKKITGIEFSKISTRTMVNK